MNKVLKLLNDLEDAYEELIEEVQRLEEDELDFTEKYRFKVVRLNVIGEIIVDIYDLIGDDLNAMYRDEA